MKKIVKAAVVLALIVGVMLACLTTAQASTKAYFPGDSKLSVTMPTGWAFHSQKNSNIYYYNQTTAAVIVLARDSLTGNFSAADLASIAKASGYTSVTSGTINGVPYAFGQSPNKIPTYVFCANGHVYQLGVNNVSHTATLTSIARTLSNSGGSNPSGVPSVTLIKAAQVGKSGVKLYYSPASGVKYSVYRSTSPSSGFIWTANLTSPTGSDTVYVATAGKTYYYKLRPYTEQNGTRYYGNYSNTEACAFLTAPTITGVTNYATNAAKVRFTTVSGANGYALYQKKQGVGDLIWKQTVGGNTAYAYNLEPGATVWFQVRGIIDQPDGTRGVGLASTAARVIVPGKPAGLTGSCTRSGAVVSADLRWNRVWSITGYEVFVSKGSSSNYARAATTTATSVRINGLPRGTAVYVKVRSYVKLADGTVAYGDYSAPIYMVTP